LRENGGGRFAFRIGLGGDPERVVVRAVPTVDVRLGRVKRGTSRSFELWRV
jgi:hypothetical protein